MYKRQVCWVCDDLQTVLTTDRKKFPRKRRTDRRREGKRDRQTERERWRGKEIQTEERKEVERDK